jgi:hypothetical protein
VRILIVRICFGIRSDPRNQDPHRYLNAH